MNKCRTCNKRIFLSKNWCLKCLEIIVNNLSENVENKYLNKNKENK
ncbi:hypothetical protein [Spiroplasma endosymbiont of Danaus chrysippus]|nr:hypothetical protein [Spiroplasma endosymbiont of Danaus chrysippus]